jgi:hypothetical protein
MRELILTIVAVSAIAYLAAFYDSPTPAEMAMANPCKQGHAMPNSCLLTAKVMEARK